MAEPNAERARGAGGELADLRSHLQGRRIAAGTDSAMYVIGRRMARHKGAVAIVTGDDTGRVSIWNPDTGAGIARLITAGPRVLDLAFKPGEPSILASSGADGRVMLWDMETDQNIPILTLERFDEWEVWALAFDRTGRRLMATNSIGLSAIWDLRHFNRHMGGNMLYQVNQHGAELGPDFDEAAARELAELLIGRGKKIKRGE